MWRAPYRPREESISQTYNDGLVDIYAIHSDAARPGYQPRPVLEKKGSLAFAERRLGIQRLYSGRQDQVEIERVLRVPQGFAVNSQNVAVIRGTDVQYRIDSVQAVPDVYPASWDLTLARVTQKMDMEEGEGDGANDLV